MNPLKKSFWFFVLAIQIILGVGAGILFLSFVKVDAVVLKGHIGSMAVGSVSDEDIKKQLDSYYTKKIGESSVKVSVDGKLFSIPYSDIEVSLDVDGTVGKLQKLSPKNGFKALFSNGIPQIDPVLYYNTGKLTESLETILKEFEIASAPESYVVEGGKLKHNSQIPGRKANYTYIEQLLYGKILSFSPDALVLSTQDKSAFTDENGRSLEGGPFTTIVAKSSIPVTADTEKKAQDYLNSINGKVFKSGDTISLAAMTDFSSASTDVEKDLLDRVATSLFQATLPIEGMQIKNHLTSEQVVAYTESGLEAVIRGENPDLSLTNNTGKPVLLLAELKDNCINIYTVSNSELKSGILIVQKRDEVPPPVITSYNSALSKDEIKIVSEGMPGFTAYVSRIIDNDRTELYSHQYKPVSKFVETGAGKPVKGAK